MLVLVVAVLEEEEEEAAVVAVVVLLLPLLLLLPLPLLPDAIASTSSNASHTSSATPSCTSRRGITSGGAGHE